VAYNVCTFERPFWIKCFYFFSKTNKCAHSIPFRPIESKCSEWFETVNNDQYYAIKDEMWIKQKIPVSDDLITWSFFLNTNNFSA